MLRRNEKFIHKKYLNLRTFNMSEGRIKTETEEITICSLQVFVVAVTFAFNLGLAENFFKYEEK